MATQIAATLAAVLPIGSLAVGEKTTIADGYITQAGYIPAPDVFLLQAMLSVQTAELAAQGIDPRDVTHGVISAHPEGRGEFWVSTSPLNGDFDHMEYTRVE